MDDLYTIPVASDPKHGLGLLDSELDTLQLPTLCGEFDHEQLLALDDHQNFFLTLADAGVFGGSDGVLSRASTAATPQSDHSTRTTFSANNVSPASDILSFTDELTSEDVETMYHDTAHSITSGRQSRATSVTWQTPSGLTMGSNNTLTPPTRPVALRPQSLSYRTQQIGRQDNQTPPPPSSFFPSPSLQAQVLPSSSPFLSPNMHSPVMPLLTQLPVQNTFMQGSFNPNPSSYYIQPQSQSLSSQQQLQQQQKLQHQQLQHQQLQHQQLQHQQLQQQQLQHQQLQQQQLQHQFQQQLQFQQQQALAHRHSLPTQTQSNSQMSTLYPHHQFATQTYNTNSPIATPSPTNSNTPSLPNTTGDSSTGYQCFSHGCGGRHFSNWGNLVRHHRERQLRSKAGAKPTCPRCGKGFTRSSARDAHVAGLKCVLGRRRRTNTNTTNLGTEDQSTASADETTESDDPHHIGDDDISGETEVDQDQDVENGSDASRDDNDLASGDCEDGDNLDSYQHQIYQHTQNLLDPINMSADIDIDIGIGTKIGNTGNTRHVYLVPQQLQFEH